MRLFIAGIVIACCSSLGAADTWSKILSFGVNEVAVVSSSSDGTYLIAGVYNGHLLQSSNGGGSWTTSNAPSLAWYGVASRGDGKVAIAQVYNNGGLYMTTDYGITWTAISSAPQLSWNGISSSQDGSTWFATSNSPNAIYRSTDGGFHWSSLSSVPSPLYWSGVSCNSDCSVIYASDGGGKIYKSTNAGGSWFTLSTPSLSWTSVFASADGTRIATVAFNNGIYLSTNSGTSFFATSAATNNWEFVTATSDCGVVFAADQNGQVWESFNLFPSFNPTLLPTQNPTAPTQIPTCSPTTTPTLLPSQLPTHCPSHLPTQTPSSTPSQPTSLPTAIPSTCPSTMPTPSPSITPSMAPTSPTAMPTPLPSALPSPLPSADPSPPPSAAPSPLPTASPSYTPSQPTYIPSATPSYSPNDCVRQGVNLTSLVLDSNGVQNCFVSATTDFIYSFTVPVCGTASTACSGFGPSDIGQIGTTSGRNNYNLGTYTESWVMTTYLGQRVLSVEYLGGTYCPGVGTRSSELVLLCNRAMGAASVFEYETNCSYVFVVQTSDSSLCDTLLPLPGNPTLTPTVSVDLMSNSTEGLSSSCPCDSCGGSSSFSCN